MQADSRQQWMPLCLFWIWIIGLGCQSQAIATPPTLPPLVTPNPVLGSTPTLFVPASTPTFPPLLPDIGSMGDPYIPELGNLGYDVQRYTLQFTLDPANPYVIGQATLDILSTSAPLYQLWLDFTGFNISRVEIDGIPATYVRQDKKLIINLPLAKNAGNSFTVTIAYQGEPQTAPSPYIPVAETLGFYYPGDGSLFAFSEPDGARHWFPANDHPRDKATFRIELTVPTGLTGVANGNLITTEELGDQSRFVWEHNYPMATYLAVVAVGEYVRLESVSDNGIPLRHYIFADAVEEFQKYAGINEEALAWMSELFAPYPFDSYGYVTVNLPGLSMETQTMVLLSTHMIGQRTMTHELAHQWFGDWVSLDSWGEMWRNEGFATYATIMWLNRNDPEALELEMAGVESAVQANNSSHPLLNPPANALFGYETYFKGALLIHALRQQIGDEAFFNGLRLYFERYGGKTASQTDFQAVMEESAGTNLDTFFAQWLE